MKAKSSLAALNIRWKIVVTTFATLGALVMLYPLLWMASSSFKPELEIFRDLSLIPKSVTFDNYVIGWRGTGGITFATFYKNTFIIVGLAVIGTVVSASMAGFAFGRLKFKLRTMWFGLMLATIMLPFHVTLIPRYILFDRIGWLGTFLPLIVPRFVAQDAFFIFLFVQFVRTIPLEIDQSAVVDGCNPVQIYLRLTMPLCVPAIVTTMIFTFIWQWNNFLAQLIFLIEPAKYTVALGLRQFQDATSESANGALFAMSLVSLIPIFTLFVSAQRFLVEGISTTGLKG